MKTRNIWLFVLTAVLCGAFLCADSQASVCFVPNGDCGGDTVFGNTDNLDDALDKRCQEAGYDKTVCGAGDIKYQCPYKSTQLMCCDKKYHYEGCIYPLEIDNPNGKCGTRYACRCPSEYGVDSTYAEKNNCQPGGGYCMSNDGVTDTIKYKTCTCDQAVYTDEGTTCGKNQDKISQCTDDKGKSRVKCYCNRDKYPYAACTYGPSVGASTCIDSNSGREYYSKCKTAEEACRTYDDEEDGDSLGTSSSSQKHTGFQHTDCSGVRNCRTKNKVTYDGKTDYLTSSDCILGEVCPYPTNPNLYKCVFNKASWCVSKGYTKTSSVKVTNNTTCTTEDGFVGKYETCPANDNTALYYYRCKLSCEQEVRRAFSKGYLTQDTSMVGDNGQVSGYVRIDSSGNKHLYFIGDITLPKSGMSTNNGGFSAIGNKVAYTSVNGMFALGNAGMKYNDGTEMFAGCKEEQSQTLKRPVVKFNGNMINKDNTFLNQFMSDLAIEFTATNTAKGGGGFGKNFIVSSDQQWHNISLIAPLMQDQVSSSCFKTENGHNYINCDMDTIVVKSGKTLTLTGTVRVESSYYTVDGYTDFYTGQKSSYSPLIIRIENSGVVKFQDATIRTHDYYSGYLSWDGDNGSVHFYNTKMADSYSNIGDFWSQLNVGLDNSNIRMRQLTVSGFAASNTGRRFGGLYDISGWPDNAAAKLSRCRGVYLNNYSTLETTEAGVLPSYTKIYVAWGSSMTAKKPIKMASKYQSLVCLDWSKITVNGKSFGATGSYMSVNGNSGDNRLMGQDSVRTQTSSGSTGIWYYKYDKGNANGQYPCGTGGTCDGKCNSDYDANCNGSNCAYLCTGCYNCEFYGMGY